MIKVKGEATTFEKLKDLKQLLSDPGPCLSIYMPLTAGSEQGLNSALKENELQWKECLQSLQPRVDQSGSDAQELVDSVRDWDAVAIERGEGEPVPVKSIAVFRSASVFQVVSLDHLVPARAELGPHFYIRPLLPELAREQSFYLLALSQKNTRLLHCTRHSSEQVPFPPNTKTDFEEWMNQVKPDHTAVYNAMTSGGQGISGPNALAPKGSDQDSKEYLAHYFKYVEGAVSAVLKGKTEPLVLCAVEYEIPMYRDVNNYPHLSAVAVHGAPNGLKAGEMHSRAIDALEQCYLKKVDEGLALWNHRVGAGASSRLKDVVMAAHEGRVLTLLVSDSQEQTGVFDEAAHTVKGRAAGTPEDEDLVNDAAVQTILHAGNVLVAPHNKMPNGCALAAIFRY